MIVNALFRPYFFKSLMLFRRHFRYEGGNAIFGLSRGLSLLRNTAMTCRRIHFHSAWHEARWEGPLHMQFAADYFLRVRWGQGKSHQCAFVGQRNHIWLSSLSNPRLKCRHDNSWPAEHGDSCRARLRQTEGNCLPVKWVWKFAAITLIAPVPYENSPPFVVWILTQPDCHGIDRMQFAFAAGVNAIYAKKTNDNGELPIHHGCCFVRTPDDFVIFVNDDRATIIIIHGCVK